jgi:hypothetical protein
MDLEVSLGMRTLLLVYTEDHDGLLAADADELAD